MPEIASLARGTNVAGLAIDQLISPADASVKGIRRFGADHFFGVRSRKDGQDFISDCNSERSLTKVLFARMERLTERDLRHEVVQCTHCNGSQFRSARFESVKRHFGMWRAFLMLSEQWKYFGGQYGKDNRVLHTAKLSQSFTVVPPGRTWQGADISTGGTKIGVTGYEMRMAKLRLSKVKQQS
jgi:hypothetical protein